MIEATLSRPNPGNLNAMPQMLHCLAPQRPLHAKAFPQPSDIRRIRDSGIHSTGTNQTFP